MTFPTKPDRTRNAAITEDQAIALLKQGDLSGLDVIVRLYQVKAVHAAMLIVHDRELAEEIAENTFYRAVLKIHQFDERRPFGPWFLRSVINAALEEITRQKKIVSLEENSDDEVGQAAEWLVDPSLCPEDIVENETLYEAVWKALDQLPPNQRAAIVMRYILDHSEVEITKSLRRPLTTIKWWLHDARTRLRRILSNEFLPANDQEVTHE